MRWRGGGMGGGKNMKKECRHQMYCTLMEVPGRWIQYIGIFLIYYHRIQTYRIFYDARTS